MATKLIFPKAMDTLPVYELVPIGWINQTLAKTPAQEVTITYGPNKMEYHVGPIGPKRQKQYVMVLKHDEVCCSGGGCPKHPMKESWMYNMERGVSKWGNAAPQQKIEQRRRH